ncbi:MAG: ATP-binding protein [Chitinispirillia bacterium]|nr:ATP-binding protein [Chitinispirillia bacterium]MCL2241338.1 ATP-binding protein [Chitinispirillia bacterium]
MFDATKIKKGSTPLPPRIVLIGIEGVGKTTAGAQCPDPIFLCAEDGLVGGGYEHVAHYAPKDWQDTIDYLQFVAEGQHNYKSLIIDTLDWLEPVLFYYVSKRDDKYHTKERTTTETNIENYGYSKGYKVAAQEFRRALALLDAIHRRGMLVIINAHSEKKVYNNPDGENYDRFEMRTDKNLAGMVKEWADTVLFAYFNVHTEKEKGRKAKGKGGDARIVQTEHSATRDGKNRYRLPKYMPFDMPAILAAISASMTKPAEKYIAEINALLPKVAEDKRKAVLDYVEQNKNNTLLLMQALTRVETLTQEETES